MHHPRPIIVFALTVSLLAAALSAQTWTGATDSNWATGTNWTPASSPNGSGATATFNAGSGSNRITLSASLLGSIIFTSDAQANTFTISNGLSFYGAGIVNQGAATQNFTNNNGIATHFYNNASLGSAALTNNGATSFHINATAGASTITNHGTLQFDSTATAGSAMITNEGMIDFYGLYPGNGSSADSATIANHGTINFYAYASGGSAAVTNDASGTIRFLDMSTSTNSLGSLAGAGSVSLGQTTLTVGSLNTDTTFSGEIRADEYSYAGGLTKVGTGTLTLTNANNRFLRVVVDTGTLALTNGSPIGYGPGDMYGADGDITVNSGGTLDLGGSTTYAYSFTVNGGTVKNGTVNGLASFVLTTGTIDAALSGDVSLEKYSNETLILGGTNTYTGQTDITAGTLLLNGSLAGGTTYIHYGATLGGNGTFHGAVEIPIGATLAPGDSVGTLTFAGGLRLADGAILDFQLGNPLGEAGVASDLIVVSGGTLLGSASADGITLNLTDAGGFGAGTYDLIRYAGATTDSFDLTDFHVGSALAGYAYTFAFAGSTLQLTATAVPEPATYAMMFGFAVLTLACWRRRRRLSDT